MQPKALQKKKEKKNKRKSLTTSAHMCNTPFYGGRGLYRNYKIYIMKS